ncbi:MAG: nitroreductase family protein [Acidimicrobiales bacterium]
MVNPDGDTKAVAAGDARDGDALAVMARRRSVGRLRPPGPDDGELRAILAAAACAPDHEELRPWRLVVLQGQAKDDFGQVLAGALVARVRAAGGEPTTGQVDKERGKLSRAPAVLVVAAVRHQHPKVPWVEQMASAAAAAYGALLAATALGYGSMWRTGDAAYDPAVKAALGLSGDDAVVGFLYLGTLPEGLDPDPHRPDLDGLVHHWAP